MSMTDPVADMLTRIRNAQRARHTEVSMPASKLKQALAQVLKDEGYITDFRVTGDAPKFSLDIDLKYHAGKPVIERIDRISKPGRRVYSQSDQLSKVLGGLGVAIISTSKGLMSDRAARKNGIGGEILCEIA